MEASLLQGRFNGHHEFAHLVAFLGYSAVNAGLDIGIGLGLLVAQPDVLQLGLDAVETQTVRQRNKDEHSLGEDLVPLVLRHMLNGAAVVQAVGQLDEHHAHVVIEGEEDALEVFGLKTLLGNVRSVGLLLGIQHVLDLGKAVYQRGNLVSKVVPDVFHGIVRVFHHIVQKGGRDGLVAQANVVYHNLGHGNGVQHIRLPAAAPHIAVGIVGKLKGLAHHFQFFPIGAALLGRCLQHLPIAGNDLVIFFSKFGKAHKLIVFW